MAGLAIVNGDQTPVTCKNTIAHCLHCPIVVDRLTITGEQLPPQCRESVQVIATVSFQTIVVITMVGKTTLNKSLDIENMSDSQIITITTITAIIEMKLKRNPSVTPDIRIAMMAG